MEVSVVGMDPSTLTIMTSRDVVISYHDNSANTTYYLQVNAANNSTVLATQNVGNATIFKMTTNYLPMMSQVKLVKFTDMATNQTLQAVQQEASNCAVGSLELGEDSNSSLFRVYDHLAEQYFTRSPECCT